jgi:indole-3-pyruvate monooxygenase
MDSIELNVSSPEYLNRAIIVGAGPAGLATAAALKMKQIPSIIFEREDCIGSLWKKKTYDRLHFHIPKQFCSLPHHKFPSQFPQYPSRYQVVEYLDEYTQTFQLDPFFNHTVVRSTHDDSIGAWRVSVRDANRPDSAMEYVAKWLVVASGENCEPVLAQVPGIKNFKGPVLHSSQYKNGVGYCDKKVLVVGSGNSGMEISLDLANHGAQPFLAVRGKASFNSTNHLDLIFFGF